MIKQILRKALLPGKKQAHRLSQHCPSNVVDNSSNHGSETSTIGRQNSDGSICFPMDPPDGVTHQQAAVAPVFTTGGQVRGNAATDKEDESNSAKRRKQGALQRRRQGIANDPMTSLYQISTLLSLSTFFEYKLSSDAARAVSQLYSTTGSSSSNSSQQEVAAASIASLGLVLSRWGYQVTLRKVLGTPSYWTKSMCNMFLVIVDSSEGGSAVEYVLDPNFKELFKTGVMSNSYRAIWQSLPPMFIGMPCQLQTVVQLLCEELELNFLEAGKPCPPWRSAGATISRWMGHKVVDIEVPAAAAPAQAVDQYLAACNKLAEGQAARSISSSSWKEKGGERGGMLVPVEAATERSNAATPAAGCAWSGTEAGPGLGKTGYKAMPTATAAAGAVSFSCMTKGSISCSSNSGNRAVPEPKQLLKGFNLASPQPAESAAACELLGELAVESGSAVEGAGEGLGEPFSSRESGSLHSQQQQCKPAGAAAAVAAGDALVDDVQLFCEAATVPSDAEEEGNDDGSIVYTMGSIPSEVHTSMSSSCASSAADQGLGVVPPAANCLLAAGAGGATARLSEGCSSNICSAPGASVAVAAAAVASLRLSPVAAAVLAGDGGACTAPAGVTQLASRRSPASSAGRVSLSKPKSLLTQRLQENNGLEQTMRGGRANSRGQEPWVVGHPGMWLARTEGMLAQKRLVVAMDEERRQAQKQQLNLQQDPQQGVRPQLYHHSCTAAGTAAMPATAAAAEAGRLQQQQQQPGNEVLMAARRPPIAPQQPEQGPRQVRDRQQAAIRLPVLPVSQSPAPVQTGDRMVVEEQHMAQLQILRQQLLCRQQQQQQQQQDQWPPRLQPLPLQQQQSLLQQQVILHQVRGRPPAIQHSSGQQPMGQDPTARLIVPALAVPRGDVQHGQLHVQSQAVFFQQQQHQQQQQQMFLEPVQHAAGTAGLVQGELPRQQRRVEPVRVLRLIPNRSARRDLEAAQERR